MSDAAHVGLFEHEVYKKPFKVSPKSVSWPTPSSYQRYGKDMPEEMDVWLVQDTGDDAMGVVSSDKGFEDNDRAEIIALGYNSGKYYGAVGIGRDSNFLQWGYHGAPSKMTDSGKKLFINCVNYISRFKVGK